MSLTHNDISTIKELFKTQFEAQTEVLSGSIRDLNEQLVRGQGKQDTRMDRMDARMDRMESGIIEIKSELGDVKVAVLELVGTDRALHSLVRELKGQHIPLNERNIFSA
ncbi:MAG: hypothetical protein WCV86_03725 [Patescibacteria group bacterium]